MIIRCAECQRETPVEPGTPIAVCECGHTIYTVDKTPWRTIGPVTEMTTDELRGTPSGSTGDEG